MSDIKRINVNSNKATINPDYNPKLNHTDASLFTAEALKNIAGYNPANGINIQNAVDVLAKKHSNLESKAAYVSKSTINSDLDISDENGNILGRFSEGHFRTLNFDSSVMTDRIFEITDKMETLEEISETHPYITDIDSSLFSLDITDESGNVLTRFSNGHIKTKKFDSVNITNRLDLLDNMYDDTSSVLNIADSNGYVIAKFKDGHIETKNFNSRNTNTYFKERPSNGIVHFTVQVDTHISDNDSNTLNYQDSQTILPDIGILILPTSYTSGGVPTRLVIHCHGAGTFITSNSTYVSNYGNIEDALLGFGYAIMDVNGTPGAADVSGNTDRHFGTPVALRSYMAAYRWCIENYNLKPDVFVEGTSMGGISSTLLCELGNIPVLAQAINCPVLDLFKQVLVYSWGVHNAAYKREAVTQKMNLNKGTKPSSWTSTAPMPANEREFFLANIESFVGWNSMWRNTHGLDFQAYMELEEPSSKTDMTSSAALAEKAMFDNVVKFREVPLKIWHAIDDGTVPYRYSKYYIEMLRRGGCLAELRTVPSGSHIFWDQMQNVSITTPYKGTINVKASVHEIINWFQRFE